MKKFFEITILLQIIIGKTIKKNRENKNQLLKIK